MLNQRQNTDWELFLYIKSHASRGGGEGGGAGEEERRWEGH